MVLLPEHANILLQEIHYPSNFFVIDGLDLLELFVHFPKVLEVLGLLIEADFGEEVVDVLDLGLNLANDRNRDDQQHYSSRQVDHKHKQELGRNLLEEDVVVAILNDGIAGLDEVEF